MSDSLKNITGAYSESAIVASAGSMETSGRRVTMAAPLNAVQMSAAIRAANEAILRARNSLEMLQGVCDAAVSGKTMLGGAVVFLPDSASSWLNAVASSGELAHIFAKA